MQTKDKVKPLSPNVRLDVEKKNKARVLVGLSPIKIKTRTCLACGQLFESAGNRTCGCMAKKECYRAAYE